MTLERFFEDLRRTETARVSSLTLIYGSCALAVENPTSDVDVIFVVLDEEERDAISVTAERELLLLHSRYGLTVDTEVPFANKLVVTKANCASATTLGGFPGSAGVRLGHLCIGPLEKSPAYLASLPMRLRLILNILTTPNIFVAGNAGYYQELLTDGYAGLARLALCLAGEKQPSVNNLVSALLKGSTAPFPEGEFFLGYRSDSKLIKRHMYSAIAQGLSILSKRTGLNFSLNTQPGNLAEVLRGTQP